VFAGSVVLTGCDSDPVPVGITEHPSNKAKGQLSGSVHYRGETRYINGELNYGIATKVTVLNVGQTGFIKVTVYLKSSEGEWSHSEEMPLCAGEFRTLTHFFPGPTHNATNIQCRASVLP
jgi:hypothetical protein